jgi:hypothetical protein
VSQQDLGQRPCPGGVTQLAAGGVPVPLMGVHLRDPVLPAVPGRRRQPHPAAAWRRLAQGMAAAGRIRLHGAPPAAGTPVPFLPAASHVRGTRSTRLAGPARSRRRPAPRPVPGSPAATGRRPARPPLRGQVDAPAPADEDSPATNDLLALQDRLLQTLRAEEPANVMSVGQPATPAQYFADLRLVCILINGPRTGTAPITARACPGRGGARRQL